VTRYTYRFHLWGNAFEALSMGLFQLNDVVARKALGASEIEITFLTMAGAGFFVFAFPFGSLMENQPKGPFIFWAGLLCRGALLFTGLTSHSMVFILLCCAVFLSEAIFIPAQTSIFKSNYDPDWRGRMLGRAMLWTRWLLPPAAIAGGLLLDRNPELYRVLFPLAGVFGFLAFVQYARIRVRTRPKPVPAKVGGSRPGFRRVLRENPGFDRFERNFYVYGVAFMMLTPVNVFLMVDHLRMSYGEISAAKLVVPNLMIALFSPLAGKIFDRFRAIRASGAAFLMIALYPLTLFFAVEFQSVMLTLLGFGFFGAAMAGVHQVWTLGPMHFSGGRDPAPFQGVHMTAGGIRSLFAPWIGHATYLLLGIGAVYLISTGLFFLASYMMFRLTRSVSPRT